MKKVIIFGFTLIAVAAVVGFFMRPNTSTSVATPSKEISFFTLYRVSGEVFYKKNDTNNFISLEEDKVFLPYNSIVKTEDGKASVLLTDKSVITLKENTEITIQDTQKGYSILQSLGSTYHRVETLLSGKTYEVKTPTTLASVRGTKFAVMYDDSKKTTKVAVTEHRVQLRDVNATSTQATSTEDTIIEEGKTATVKEEDKGRQTMSITSTEKDKEMSDFIQEEVPLDEVFESIKTLKMEEEFRQKVEEMILNDTKREAYDKEEEKQGEMIAATKKSDTTINQTTSRETATTKIVTDTSTRVIPSTTQITKMDEETFFTQFEPLFIKRFYVDDASSPCSFTGTPEDRVSEVTSFAARSGYPFDSKEGLLVLAKDIDRFCKTKDMSLKSELQKRFDTEYPFQ